MKDKCFASTENPNDVTDTLKLWAVTGPVDSDTTIWDCCFEVTPRWLRQEKANV